MCGVAGIFRYNAGPGRVDEQELDTIRDHMVRRGPDGKGSWISRDGRIGLGHRRLAIIGLGEQGAQPMAACCPRLSGEGPVVTFNGEIYNHEELRRRLELEGHVFRSRCDTEVLLHLYEEHGEDLVLHLRGMYAFGIWDPVHQRLLLARDPFGVKPLYVADDGGVLRFASQARALLAGGAVRPQGDDAALAGFLVLGSVPEPRTCWSTIRCLPAGSTMTVGGDGAATRTFFSVAQELREAASRDAEGASEALRDSVDAHLVADVPVGVFLSGGVDSGALLGLVSESSRRDVTAVTLAFDEFSGSAADEQPVASLTAHWYGARHVVERVSYDDFRTSIRSVLQGMDQPTVDGVNTWFVSRAAREAGLKVALSGLGGDELVGGYDTFSALPTWHRRLRPLALVPGLGRASRRLLQVVPPNLLNPKVASAVEYGRTLTSNWLLRRSVFLPWELAPLLGRDRAVAALETLDLERRVLAPAIVPDPGSSVSRVAAMETNLYMRNQLLRDADWASMLHSLEIRVPLVDATLYRAIAPGLSSWTAANRKAALRAAPARPLPNEVLERRKTGFGLPMERWLREADELAHWRSQPTLRREGTPWARRWAYALARQFDLVGAG